MRPYYEDEAVRIYVGDCADVLPSLSDVDAIVTDPPYGLSFMGKRWDYDVPDTEVWRACLDAVKPGAHLLAFAGTRTQHRMAVRIEDAGWEVRDMIAWVYSSGFPKSLDVSKAIDGAGGASPAEQAGVLRRNRGRAGLSRQEVATVVGCTESSVRDWEEGRARARGAPIEHIVPSAQYRARLASLLGYTEDERRMVGVSTDRRGDGSVVGLGHSGEMRAGGNTEAAKQWDGWGTALKPALEPITLARKPLVGTVAENVLEHGTGALNVDGCRVEAPEGSVVRMEHSETGSRRGYDGGLAGGKRTEPQTEGRWPANLIHDGSPEVVERFPAEAGAGAPASGPTHEGYRKSGSRAGAFNGMGDRPAAFHADSGSAARFFYCAKASRSERGEGNDHPTVKPVALMTYLIRLVTPPGGIVLDPFMGSGSTLYAAKEAGFRAIGIEREERYAEIAVRRLAQGVLPLGAP